MRDLRDSVRGMAKHIGPAGHGNFLRGVAAVISDVVQTPPGQLVETDNLEGLPDGILARTHKLAWPKERRLTPQIEKTRELLESRSRRRLV